MKAVRFRDLMVISPSNSSIIYPDLYHIVFNNVDRIIDREIYRINLAISTHYKGFKK